MDLIVNLGYNVSHLTHFQKPARKIVGMVCAHMISSVNVILATKDLIAMKLVSTTFHLYNDVICI